MKLLLGVCGSISAYRSLDICRTLAKEGHSVKVVLTRGALEFVRPEVFKYLGAQEVFHPEDDFNLKAVKERSVLHIELSKWMDRMLVAPASANTLAKMSQGMCDDLLTSVFLASPDKTCLIYPAMNSKMLEHPITQKNFAALSDLDNVFIHPTKEGLLACGDLGAGKLQDIELISETAPIINLSKPKKRILITTGATIAPLDPVRYLTNPSSGLTGYEVAKRYLELGDAVTLIAGHKCSEKINYLSCLPNITVLRANTTQEMRTLVKDNFDQHDVYISAAALSDIEFEQSSTKLKKGSLQDKLNIKKAPDVLKEMLLFKTERGTKQKTVGFAAETSDELGVFEKKWKDKPVDVLVGNRVSNGVLEKVRGFGTEDNEYTILKKGKPFYSGHLTKTQLAVKITEALED